MRSFFFLAFSSVAVLACGGNVTSSREGTGGGASTSSGTGATTSSSSSGTGGASIGDCQGDADCPGGTCVELTPGGYKVCTSSIPEATMCHPPGSPVMDQCCTSKDCGGGKCYPTAELPYCGGPAMADYNICLSDSCTSDALCQGNIPGLCAPAGVWGNPVRACIVAYCKTQADCSAQAGGECVPIVGACCSVPLGLACVYPGGCRKDQDCGANAHCEIDPSQNAAVCKPGIVGCPA